MAGLELQDDRPERDQWWTSPLAWTAGAWIVGLLIGRQGEGSSIWVTAAFVFLILGIGLWSLGSRGAAAATTALAIAAAGAAWWNLWSHSYGLEARPASRLTRVQGVVQSPIHIRTESRGVMGQFDYRPPATVFTLVADRVADDRGWRRMRGRVLVDIAGFDARIRPGDRVECTGWLSWPPGPANPGERDRRRAMRDLGVVGRLALRDAGNCLLLEPTANNLRASLAARAKAALRTGLNASHQSTVDLLEVLLLGDWNGELDEVRGAFRRAGLMHILAISGLQLAILAGGTWLVLLPLLGRPRAAALAALAAVGLLLLIVPPAVAILRSGLMAGAALGALASGRRVSPMAAMCGAAMLLLIVRPPDLLAPGFQLTFLVVAALILLTRDVANRIAPPPLLETGAGLRSLVRRRGAEWLAVALVAWLVSAPLIAHHFGTVVPAGLVTAIPVVPLVAGVMWLGYGKIALAGLWPDAGTLLNGPLLFFAQALRGVAEWAADWRLATVDISPPPAWWACATLAVVGLILTGRWRTRPRLVAVATVFLCLGLVGAVPGESLGDRFSRSALRVNMFAVGHGSCYLVRSGNHSMVFDCGSSQYADIATGTVVPALRAMGVRAIDTLVISHPDLDHFSGAVELVDAMSVRRIITTDGFVRAAAANPQGPAAVFIEAMRQRGVPVQTVSAGWRMPLGQVELAVIWPPAGAEFDKPNNGSLVLSVQAAGRKVLFTGDLEQEAMELLMADPGRADALRADVLELPHHGAMNRAAPEFLKRVNPSVVLQSANLARLHPDAWADQLLHVRRHISAVHGMVQVTVGRDGELIERRFAPDLWVFPEAQPYNDSWPAVEVNP